MKKSKILTAVCLSTLCTIALMAENKMAKENALSQHQTPNSNVKTETLMVHGNCEMCKERIEKAANSVDGVKSAHWDVKLKILTVQFDESKWTKDKSLDNVSKKIADAGYDTHNYKATDKAYNSLPKCCQYERTEKHTKPEHTEGDHHKGHH